MSLSDDDEDFLSADEDCSDVVILDKSSRGNPDKPIVESCDDYSKVERNDEPDPSKIEAEYELESHVKGHRGEEPLDSDRIDKGADVSRIDNTEEDDDEALAERIRERNLKLARKFSAEIAKNVKTSAPIPVRETPSVDFKISDIEYPSIPDADIKSCPPPAPPPTPALSSSFNSDETTSPISNPSTQYGWRIPVKPKPEPAISGEKSSPKSERARLALDRLAEKLSQPDKNIFEKVAQDIKKVSIKTSDPPISACGSGGIPLIPDLGGALGRWNWNSASKFLASAAQVTSDALVGTAPDPTVKFSQNKTDARIEGQDGEAELEETQPSSDVRVNKPDTSDRASMNPVDAISNDALVGLTLNAMESLGRKAFDVMTERDGSGSLQIKGLGRPWERLLGPSKASRQAEGDDIEQVSDLSSMGGFKTADTETSTLKSRKKHLAYQDDGKLD